MPSIRLPAPAAALLAYALWGVLPLYWKALQALPALAILGYRIIFALVFVVLLVLALRRGAGVRALLADRRRLLLGALAAVLISVNWGLYIWAVNAGMIVECSLGYYINPLVSVGLGMLFLRERLTRTQAAALALAAAGVAVMGVDYGRLPWVSLCLAASFGLYGLAKKLIGGDALVGLGLETAWALPVAAACLLVVGPAADPAAAGGWGWALVLLAGPVTAVPLVLFGNAAGRMPLSQLGFYQYLSPTISLVIGVLVYHERFGPVQLASFGLIWIALAVFSVDQIRRSRKPGVQAQPSVVPSKS